PARPAGVVRPIEPAPAPRATLRLSRTRQVLIDPPQQLEQPHVREHALVHCRSSFLFVEKGEHPLGTLVRKRPRGGSFLLTLLEGATLRFPQLPCSRSSTFPSNIVLTLITSRAGFETAPSRLGIRANPRCDSHFHR